MVWNKLIIEPGTRYGKLTVIEEITEPGKRYRVFKCSCDCGNTTTTLLTCLRQGKSRSCGCLKLKETTERNDKTRGRSIVGIINGSWQVTYYKGRSYNCRCTECGNERVFNESSFKCGGISSCCVPVVKNAVYYKRALRTCISMAIRKKYTKTRKSDALLGCSISEAIAHIEKQFLPGMSWKNKSSPNMSGWDIDHICPCSQAQNEEELIKLQHYTNLRPMWAMDNRVKCSSKTPEAEAMCLELLGRKWIDIV
jgi:hypothetical protein